MLHRSRAICSAESCPSTSTNSVRLGMDNAASWTRPDGRLDRNVCSPAAACILHDQGVEGVDHLKYPFTQSWRIMIMSSKTYLSTAWASHCLKNHDIQDEQWGDHAEGHKVNAGAGRVAATCAARHDREQDTVERHRITGAPQLVHGIRCGDGRHGAGQDACQVLPVPA